MTFNAKSDEVLDIKIIDWSIWITYNNLYNKYIYKYILYIL